MVPPAASGSVNASVALGETPINQRVGVKIKKN
jgi:hypothetical protein